MKIPHKTKKRFIQVYTHVNLPLRLFFHPTTLHPRLMNTPKSRSPILHCQNDHWDVNLKGFLAGQIHGGGKPGDPDDLRATVRKTRGKANEGIMNAPHKLSLDGSFLY
jgi:hypothetical protein